jgi:type IV pilus assembly protein PilC
MSASYAFRAVDALGVKHKGEVEADSPQGVSDLLKGRGLIPLEVKPKTKSMELSLEGLTRITLEDLALMTRQLSTMISSGLSLMRALMVLESQVENKRLKATVVQIRLHIESGASLSDALARHPKIFSQLYIAMIRAGETGGFLESSLLRVADQLEAQSKLRRQVKSAMVYPAVVSIIAVCVVSAMLIFIIPVFAGVFKQFHGTMPTLTVDVMKVSNVLRHQSYFVLIGAVALVVGFRKWKASKFGRPTWDRLRLKAPAKIGPVVQKVALARWARTLSSLTGAGVPMLEAIDVTGRTAGNTVVENAMAAVHRSVQGGGTIAAALADEPIFPSLVTNMVRVGEETGALDDTLAKVADFYEEQVEAAVKALTSILEPIMIAVIGSVIGFMILAMYLPLFHVYDAIR